MNSLSAALSSIRRSPYQALAAILLTTVTFSVAFALSYFLSGAQMVLQYYETRPQIIGFFEIEATDDQVNKVKEAMESKSYVTEVKITNKEDALKLYTQEYQDSPMLLELVTPEILPVSIEVSASDISSLSQVKQDLEKSDGVEDVNFQEDVVDTLRSWTGTARYVGIASAAILMVLSFLVITIIVGMRVGMQKKKIAIMRLIGATRWYVKRPFMSEGLIYSTIGAIIGWGIATGTVYYLMPEIKSFVSDIQLFPIPLSFLAMQFGIGVLFAMFLGGFAGFVASQRMIRK